MQSILNELTSALCSVALLSAIVEVMLSEKRGERIICTLLGFAGMGMILSQIATLQ